MSSISTLIDFLMNLLRDENAKAQFERDPHAALAAHGLHDVSGQDVRDARLIMADDGAVHPKHGGGRSHHARSEHDDPVREIHHTTQQYAAAEHGGYHYTAGDVNQTFTILNIDDRDTVIDDSFNSDDDGIDNKGGKISESVLAGDDIDGQVGVDNADDVDVVAINESFNEDNRTSTDVDVVNVEDSFNRTEPTQTQPAPGSPAPDANAPDASTSPDAPNAPDAPDAGMPDPSTPDPDPPQADAPDPGAPVDQPLMGRSAVDEPPVDQLPVDHSTEEPIAEEHSAEDHSAGDPALDVPDDEPDLDHALV